MQLGETIATYDLGLALRGENGKFEVTSPTAEIYFVTCKPNHSISNLEWAGSRTNPQPFLIRKIAETISLEARKETAAEESQLRGGTPFLLEAQQEGAERSSAESAVVVLARAGEENLEPETAVLDLVYVEGDSEAKLPTASVLAKSIGGNRTAGLEASMTARCTSINELDAEIRKLHAQLDEIRARAKKKFYSTHAAAATA
jgi:hypothetical protein